ncbi:MAG: tRNA (guanosine(37)-N1)-methyltransferase TrmD [Actinomycetota bacterium]|nr:tRNA (guanosine(37)-N1)-methyltransferase TrmD [Actinomycetota bacterium]MDQ5829310.1 tRNA (guanosine(37)-N1)-methyltransferase TrmD [Actinomycetota bacterium]
MKNVDVFCVFPSAVDGAVRVGVVGRAIERGVVGYRSFDLREYAPGGRIDDMPFGGGAGMVVRVDVVARAFEEVYGVAAKDVRNERRVVLTEAWGQPITQGYVNEVAEGQDLTIVCGRYGGVDERVRTALVTETVSLGDFVLSGGEIVAAALADAAIRRLGGVLGNAESLRGESFSEGGMVGPPVYTRPAEWDGEAVPGVLLSGNHTKIDAWREEQARLRASQRDSGDAE